MPLDFAVRGDGPPLVLIHGLFGTRENLGALARILADDFQIYSLDLLNHGRSPHADEFDLAYMAKTVEQWMDQQGLPKANFFGHSLGGKVAMELALSSPEKVERLVVADIAPVKYEHRHEQIFSGLRSINLEGLTSRMDADKLLAEAVPEKAVRSFLLKNLQKNENGRFFWRMNLVGLQNNYAKIIDGNRDAVFAEPVLFLKAENSDYIKAEHQPDIMRRFPNAEAKVIGSTGHWLHAEKPELIAALVKRFLS